MQSLSTPASTNLMDPSDRVAPTNYAWYPICQNNGAGIYAPPNSPIFSGICTPGSNVVTGTPTILPSGVGVGSLIFGSGIPGIFYYPFTPATTTITATGVNQITLSNNAMISGYQMLSHNPYSTGRPVFNFARFYNTNPSSTQYSWSSPNIYVRESWASGLSDSFGAYVNVTSGPSGLKDVYKRQS